jgi:hypothetical protein
MINYILYLLGYKVYEQPIILCVNSFQHTNRKNSTPIEKFPNDDDEEPNQNYNFNLYKMLKRCYINSKIYNSRN